MVFFIFVKPYQKILYDFLIVKHRPHILKLNGEHKENINVDGKKAVIPTSYNSQLLYAELLKSIPARECCFPPKQH